MDQHIFYKKLLDRYVNNTATADELEVIDHLIRTGELEDLLMVHMAESWEAEEAVFESRNTDRPGHFKLWPRIAMIAAAVIAIISGIWFFSAPIGLGPGHPSVHLSETNHIKPGKNTAILTLAHGETVRLSDTKNGIVIHHNKFTYNDGTEIGAPGNGKLDQAYGQVQTITTPRGGTYQVTLSDGTKVWLNSASSLTYNSLLNEQGKRRVELAGEAYFEVAKDKKHPFIVKSAGQEVEVLGTHFNISSYADDGETKTTLLEGRVRVTASKLNNGLKDQVNLDPGQQSILTSARLSKQNINAEEVIAWKNGYFLFVNEDLQRILREVGRWYDVDIVYQGKLTDKRFGGMVSRSKNIAQVLKIIQKTGNVKIKIEGRRVIIMP